MPHLDDNDYDKDEAAETKEAASSPPQEFDAEDEEDDDNDGFNDDEEDDDDQGGDDKKSPTPRKYVKSKTVVVVNPDGQRIIYKNINRVKQVTDIGAHGKIRRLLESGGGVMRNKAGQSYQLWYQKDETEVLEEAKRRGAVPHGSSIPPVDAPGLGKRKKRALGELMNQDGSAITTASGLYGTSATLQRVTNRRSSKDFKDTSKEKLQDFLDEAVILPTVHNHKLDALQSIHGTKTSKVPIQDACIACQEARSSVLFEPCRHAVLCQTCVVNYCPKFCPLCWTTIQRRLYPRHIVPVLPPFFSKFAVKR